MKALLHTAPFRLEYVDVPDPVPGPNDVIVRVDTVGICGSDLHGYTGESGRRIPPIVMGHEAGGVIASAGKNVPDTPSFRIGQRVCFDSTVFCNQCPACLERRYNRCVQRQVLGVSVPGMKRQGAMAEAVQLPWWALVPVPDSMSLERAALVEPVAIAVHAVGVAEIPEGASVLVIGAGTIGLFIVQAARLAGAGRILVSEPNSLRRSLAESLGADVSFNPTASELGSLVRTETQGRGADVVLEAVGFAPTIQAAVGAARMGGRVVLVGNLATAVALNPQELISRELEIRGSYASSGEYPTCVELVAAGKISVEPLISDVVPLSEGARAFERLLDNRENLIKILLKP